MNKSIWQDTYYETTGSSKQFALSTNGNTIYNGKAYAKPNTSNIKINVTNICENYLKSELPDLKNFSGNVNTEIYKTFVLSIYNELSDTWSTAETYTFLMNYDRDFTPSFNTAQTLNDPVNLHAAIGQVTPESNYNRTIISSTNADYDFGYCGLYALIYLNARGGWDSLLLEGKCKKTDSYTVSKYSSNYDNNTTGFGSTRYMNIIRPTWELNTGWLKEDESKRFVKHVSSSNKVYLQNLVSGEIIPVNITDASMEYKDYQNQDNSPINYTINVEGSQEYKRK